MTNFDHFLIWGFFYGFFLLYFYFLFFYILIFLNFWNFLKFLYFLWIFFWSLGFLSKLPRLLIKVTKVTTAHQKLPKIGQISIISSLFCIKGKKSLSRSPPQELEVGLCSRPYLLVIIKDGILRFNSFNIHFKRGVYFTVHSIGRLIFNEINGVIISLMIIKMIYCLY